MWHLFALNLGLKKESQFGVKCLLDGDLVSPGVVNEAPQKLFLASDLTINRLEEEEKKKRGTLNRIVLLRPSESPTNEIKTKRD